MGRAEEGSDLALSERGARDLLNHVIEFLQYIQYYQTVQALLDERASKRSQLNNSLLPARTRTKDVRERLRAEMLRKFDEGRRDDFFTLWQQYVPASMLGLDFATQKLEFYLQVYFAIYPALPSSSVLVATPGTTVIGSTGGPRHSVLLGLVAAPSLGFPGPGAVTAGGAAAGAGHSPTPVPAAALGPAAAPPPSSAAALLCEGQSPASSASASRSPSPSRRRPPPHPQRQSPPSQQQRQSFGQEQLQAPAQAQAQRQPLQHAYSHASAQQLHAVSPAASSARHELGLRMKVFKSYLEGRGAGLAQTTEFLPYYALPYVPQPEHHPCFEGLFAARWAEQQRRTLRAFLEDIAVREAAAVPLLYALYERHLQDTDGVPRLSPRARALRAAQRSRQRASRQGQPDWQQGQEGQQGDEANQEQLSQGQEHPPHDADSLPPPQYHQQHRNTAGGGGGGSGGVWREGLRSSNAGAAAGSGDASGGGHAYGSRGSPYRTYDEYASGEGDADEEEEAEEMAAVLRSPGGGFGDDEFHAADGDGDGGGGGGGLQSPPAANAQHLFGADGDGADAGPAAGAGDGDGGGDARGDGGGGRSLPGEEPTLRRHRSSSGSAASAANAAGGDGDGCDDTGGGDGSRGRGRLRGGRGGASLAMSLGALGLTESAVLRDSVVLMGGAEEEEGEDVQDDHAATEGEYNAEEEEVAAEAAEAEGSGVNDTSLPASPGGVWAPLDYKAIKRDLQGPDPGLAARLLQALRWRLLRSSPGRPRSALLASWAEADLLGHGTPPARPPAPEAPQAMAAPEAAAYSGAAGGGASVTFANASEPHANASASSVRPSAFCPPSTPTPLLAALTGAGTDPRVAEEAARLAAAMACERLGRRYLLTIRAADGDEMLDGAGAAAEGRCELDGHGAVALLWGLLQRCAPATPNGLAEHGAQLDQQEQEQQGQSTAGRSRLSPAGLHALTALQRLSVRRGAQSCLIRNGAVGWLAEVLQDLEPSLEPLAIEYGTALLRNLCLRSAGRAAAAAPEVAASLLRLCEGLLPRTELSGQVRFCLCGLLFSAFRHPALREAALTRGTGDLLEGLGADEADGGLADQIEQILSQLYMPDADLDPDLDPDGASAADGVGPDDNETDANLDADPEPSGAGSEALDPDPYTDLQALPESLQPSPGEPVGEALLCGGGYLAAAAAAREHLAAVRRSLAADKLAVATAAAAAAHGRPMTAAAAPTAWLRSSVVRQSHAVPRPGTAPGGMAAAAVESDGTAWELQGQQRRDAADGDLQADTGRLPRERGGDVDDGGYGYGPSQSEAHASGSGTGSGGDAAAALGAAVAATLTISLDQTDNGGDTYADGDGDGGSNGDMGNGGSGGGGGDDTTGAEAATAASLTASTERPADGRGADDNGGSDRGGGAAGAAVAVSLTASIASSSLLAAARALQSERIDGGLAGGGRGRASHSSRPSSAAGGGDGGKGSWSRPATAAYLTAAAAATPTASRGLPPTPTRREHAPLPPPSPTAAPPATNVAWPGADDASSVRASRLHSGPSGPDPAAPPAMPASGYSSGTTPPASAPPPLTAAPQLPPPPLRRTQSGLLATPQAAAPVSGPASGGNAGQQPLFIATGRFGAGADSRPQSPAGIPLAARGAEGAGPPTTALHATPPRTAPPLRGAVGAAGPLGARFRRCSSGGGRRFEGLPWQHDMPAPGSPSLAAAAEAAGAQHDSLLTAPPPPPPLLRTRSRPASPSPYGQPGPAADGSASPALSKPPADGMPGDVDAEDHGNTDVGGAAGEAGVHQPAAMEPQSQRHHPPRPRPRPSGQGAAAATTQPAGIPAAAAAASGSADGAGTGVAGAGSRPGATSPYQRPIGNHERPRSIPRPPHPAGPAAAPTATNAASAVSAGAAAHRSTAATSPSREGSARSAAAPPPSVAVRPAPEPEPEIVGKALGPGSGSASATGANGAAPVAARTAASPSRLHRHRTPPAAPAMTPAGPASAPDIGGSSSAGRGGGGGGGAAARGGTPQRGGSGAAGGAAVARNASPARWQR